MKFISSLLVTVSLIAVYAAREERARISGDKNRIEQEFWEIWGQKGIHSWGDLTKWTDEVRFRYCSGYYRKVIGNKLPPLQVVPQIKTAIISMKFQSPLSKQLGFYGRKIRNVQVIHCPMTVLQLKNPNQKLDHVYDFYLTKKSKKDNCLLEILPQIDVRTFEGIRQIKTSYYLASEICWPLVKREKSGLPIRRTKSDSEEMYKNLHQRSELRKTQSGAKREAVNAAQAVPETQVDDPTLEVEHTEESARKNKEEDETKEFLIRDENEAQQSSHHVGEAEPENRGVDLIGAAEQSNEPAHEYEEGTEEQRLNRDENEAPECSHHGEEEEEANPKNDVDDLAHAAEQTKEAAYKNEEGTEEYMKGDENEATESSHHGGEAVPENRIDDHEVEPTYESTNENKNETEMPANSDANEVLQSLHMDRHLDEHFSEEPGYSHSGITEDQQELHHEVTNCSDHHSNSNYFDQQMATLSSTAVETENVTSEHYHDHMDSHATPTLLVEKKQDSAYNSDTEFQTPTSLLSSDLKMDTEKTESVHNDEPLDKSDTPTSIVAEKHNSEYEPDSSMSTIAENHSSDEEPDSPMSTMAEKHSSDDEPVSTMAEKHSSSYNDPGSPIFFMAEKNRDDIEPGFSTSFMEEELNIETEKADNIHSDDRMDILVTPTSPVAEKRNSEFDSHKQPSCPTSPVGEKQSREYNCDNEPGTLKSPTKQNEFYIHTSDSEYASPTGENVEMETEKQGRWFPSEEEPHFSPVQFETYDDDTEEELEKKVHWSPTNDEPHFSPDEFGTYDDISYHELKNI